MREKIAACGRFYPGGAFLHQLLLQPQCVLLGHQSIDTFYNRVDELRRQLREVVVVLSVTQDLAHCVCLLRGYLGGRGYATIWVDEEEG